MIMARKYQVQHTVPLGTPSDPNSVVAQGVIDLPVLLSQRLQRNIRQGRVIHIHSVQASLSAPASGNLDLGLGVVGEIRHCPATKNSVKAWQHLFGVWRKQKALKVAAIGPMVRYDDFEVGYNSSFLGNDRISTLYTTGNADDTDEHAVIYGGSTEASHVSLEDMYEAMVPKPSASRFPLSNEVVKASKFTEEFPPTVKTPFGASWSAIDAQENHDSGAQFQQPIQPIHDTASLCGVVYFMAKAIPENVITSIQDDLELTLTFTVSIGSSLVPKPRPKTTKGGKRVGRKSTRRKYRRRRS
jgi:hypothetical protein